MFSFYWFGFYELRAIKGRAAFSREPFWPDWISTTPARFFHPFAHPREADARLKRASGVAFTFTVIFYLQPGLLRLAMGWAGIGQSKNSFRVADYLDTIGSGICGPYRCQSRLNHLECFGI